MRKSKPDASAVKLQDIIQSGIEAATSRITGDFAFSVDQCESPIEKLLAAAFVHPATGWEYETRVELLKPPSGLVEHCVPPPFPGVYLWQQVKVGPYRVDFMLDSTPGDGLPRLIVECDGHDFHEKTKEQAQRDKGRDRFLVGRGFRVIRFTGSEIFADPIDTAHQVLQILLGIAP